MILQTNTITIGDLATEALRESGAIGQAQQPSKEDINGAWFRIQSMLQKWQVERYVVYHLVTLVMPSTGAVSYSVGPGGYFNTGPADGSTQRPSQIESGFLRQLTQSQPNQIDYPLELLQSMEDYASIALKGLVSFASAIFYDPSWGSSPGLGTVYVWPVPNANIYGIGLVYRENLPQQFASLAAKINLPFEYYEAILTNGALALRAKYGIPNMPGDTLVDRARQSKAALRKTNTMIKALNMPRGLSRGGIYNIFSDRTY